MYIRNTSKNASEIFLETEAERQHFENIRKQIRSLEAEAGRVVCAQAAIELESYARQLADSNKKIAEYQKEYDRLSWLRKFLTSAPPLRTSKQIHRSMFGGPGFQLSGLPHLILI